MTEPRKGAGESGSDRLVQELREVLGRMEVALGLLPDAVVWSDREGRVRWCNAAFDRVVSRPHIEILGADFARMLPLEAAGAAKAPGAEHPAARAGGGERSGQGRYLYRSRLLEIQWQSTRWEEEDVHVFLLRDLTEQQRNIEELEAFSYSVAHDLRAPLRHIDGFIQLLQEEAAGKLDERCQGLLDRISHAAKRLGSLIDELLAFSRTARAELQKAPVSLGALAAEVVAECREELQDRMVEWKLGALPVVEGDAAMLKQVFANLIGNAVKFSRDRETAVIEIGAAPGAPAEAVVFVRDNGVGFDMRFAEKLFGVFQRLHRMEEFEGTGIGLANVRRIVAKHGGRTWAEGEVDKGAAFYFSLPALKTEAKA